MFDFRTNEKNLVQGQGPIELLNIQIIFIAHKVERSRQYLLSTMIFYIIFISSNAQVYCEALNVVYTVYV